MTFCNNSQLAAVPMTKNYSMPYDAVEAEADAIVRPLQSSQLWTTTNKVINSPLDLQWFNCILLKCELAISKNFGQSS